MTGGQLIINGTAGPSEISVGDSTVGGTGSGPAVFNLSGGTSIPACSAAKPATSALTAATR